MKQSNPLFSLLAMLCLSVMFVACGGGDDDNTPSGHDEPGGGGGTTPTGRNINANIKTLPEYGRLEMPHFKNSGTLIVIHKTTDSYDPDGVNYSLEWDTKKRSSRWVAYQMHKGYSGSSGRTDAWAEDPNISVPDRFSDTRSMYSGSGFTRGHICPSADRTYSRQANEQTFYYSNMQPQYYNFNAGDGYTGAWVIMENQLRKWTNQLGRNDTIYVVKGGTIEDGLILEKIKGQLIVPKYFFTALLLKNSSGYRALGMWFEHTNAIYSNLKLADYVVNIDELERLTGIDFFCNLPDLEENKVESLDVDKILTVWGLN